MKIQKIIFENSIQFEHHIQNKGFDFIMQIETNDVSYRKEKIVNLGVLTKDHSFSFEILKELLDYFSDELINEKIEIDELIFRIHSENKAFSYLIDTWSSFFLSGEEEKYRNELKKKLYIKSIDISLPQSTKDFSLRHMGFISDTIRVSTLSTDSVESISINCSKSLYIDGANKHIKEIRIGDLLENQRIYLRNIISEKVQILNLGYPFQNRELNVLELIDSKIESIEIRGFSEAIISINETKFWSAIINGGVFDNIKFNKISLVDSRITNTGFYDLVFPRRNTNFLVKNLKLEKNIYSNIDWGNYFSEYEVSTYTKNGKTVEKRWHISKGGLKETYRMLKYEHDEIGNKTEANKFFAKEMEYYEKSLSWKTDWDKKLVSMLQRYSNNYGNSWILPLGWIFVLSGLYTSLHLFGNIQASHCWHGFCFHVAPYGVFFNEVIKNINVLDDFKNIDNAGIFLYRISIAFFIYQFIVALRRISQR